MCTKDVSPLDGHLTHHDSRLHDCTDGLIAPKSLPHGQSKYLVFYVLATMRGLIYMSLLFYVLTFPFQFLLSTVYSRNSRLLCLVLDF